MDISNFKKSDVLRILYNNAKPQGMGHMHYDPIDMTEKEADELLKNQTYFDYVKGRVMKVRLDSHELDTKLYNRDNGELAAEKALSVLVK